MNKKNKNEVTECIEVKAQKNRLIILLTKLKNLIFGSHTNIMHFTVSWRTKPVSIQLATLHANLITKCFFRNEKIKVWESYYIIKVKDQFEYVAILNEILNKTLNVADLEIIVTPPMIGGLYNGVLPAENWADVNKIVL